MAPRLLEPGRVEWVQSEPSTEELLSTPHSVLGVQRLETASPSASQNQVNEKHRRTGRARELRGQTKLTGQELGSCGRGSGWRAEIWMLLVGEIRAVGVEQGL